MIFFNRSSTEILKMLLTVIRFALSKIKAMLSLIDEADVLWIFHCCQSQLNRRTSEDVMWKYLYLHSNCFSLTMLLNDSILNDEYVKC